MCAKDTQKVLQRKKYNTYLNVRYYFYDVNIEGYFYDVIVKAIMFWATFFHLPVYVILYDYDKDLFHKS